MLRLRVDRSLKQPKRLANSRLSGHSSAAHHSIIIRSLRKYFPSLKHCYRAISGSERPSRGVRQGSEADTALRLPCLCLALGAAGWIMFRHTYLLDSSEPGSIVVIRLRACHEERRPLALFLQLVILFPWLQLGLGHRVALGDARGSKSVTRHDRRGGGSFRVHPECSTWPICGRL